MTLTRRDILMQVGMAGGAGATFAAMQMLGLTPATPAAAADFALPAGSGKGRSVVVLGAGIAGLVATYELQRAGYTVTMLEARDRVGGRVWTIRGNEPIVQMDRPQQRASFSPGLYFNAGAARIPSVHHAILGYAKRLGVPMETFVNSHHATGWDFGGKVHRGRHMIYSFQSRLAELLAKAVDGKALNSAMPKEELEQFRQFLGFYGGLDAKGVPTGQAALGFTDWPGGYDDPGRPLDPLTLKDVLPGQAAAFPQIFQSIIDMQPTMLQPVGGMDRDRPGTLPPGEDQRPFQPAGQRHPPRGRSGPDRASRRRHPRRFLRLHAAGQFAQPHPQRFLPGQASGAQGRALSEKRQGRI